MAILEAIPERWIVTFVVVLITFLQLTTNFYVIGPALGGWFTLTAQKVLAFMNIPLISLYVNYYLACTTHPGYAPKEWEPPSSILTLEINRLGFNGPRYCKKCNGYKPPRSHHCKYCGKCVLKMDHHCPWIGNCVGHANYPHFVRFVYSVVICCSYGCFLMLWRLQRIMDAWNNRWVMNPSYMDAVAALTVLVLAGLVNMMVGVLAIYHTYCLFKGQTTIEGSERTKTRRLVRRKKIDKVDFPFDVGFYENICSILGHNPLLWFWPQKAPGDGLVYAVKPETDPFVIYAWPPKNPKDLGQQIIQEQAQETVRGPQLVRRDSEGYLVREITMEDRMRMLQHDYMFDEENRDPLEYESYPPEDGYYYEDENGEYIEGEFVEGEYLEGEYLEGEYIEEYVEGEYIEEYIETEDVDQSKKDK